MEIDQVQAGEYELVAEQFDQPLSKPGEPFNFKRYVRGDKVTLDVAEARRLYAGGAVVLPGEREKLAAQAAVAAAAAALALVPEEFRDQISVDALKPAPSVAPGPEQTPGERLVTGPTRGARR